MKRKDRLLRRYLLFFAGLCVSAFGVALTTKAALGTSPLAAIPYTLSLILPRLTLGNWTILFSLLLILLQPLLLKKHTNVPELLLQVVIMSVFGYFIDLAMFCLAWLMPAAYLMQLLTLLISCAVLAFGAYLQVTADVVMLSGDALIRAVAFVTGKEYADLRVVNDVLLTVIAAVLCLIFLHALVGVREGTVIAAFLVGVLVKCFIRCLKPLSKRLMP